jgi:hypothetical protein
MSRTVALIYNTIIGGKFYTAGDPINAAILPRNLQQYIAKPTQEEAAPPSQRQLNFSLNRPYSVDKEGYLRRSPERQAAQMEAEVSEEEMIADDLAEAEDSATVASAIEQAREEYHTDVERQKLQASLKARRQEDAEEFLRQEEDSAVESGDFDQWNVEALRRPRASSVKVAPRASASSGLKIKGKRSFVLREKRFVLASGRRDLIIGETLYRRRPKSFGVAERYIAFGKVRKESWNV